jgi:osmotically-inducible protein OsmY
MPMRITAGMLVCTLVALVACSPQQQQQSQAAFKSGTAQEGAKLSNGALEVKVSAAIAAEAGTNAFHITPKARNGEVTLTGNVPNERIHATVLDTVRRVPGVTSIVDHLAVHA